MLDLQRLEYLAPSDPAAARLLLSEQARRQGPQVWRDKIWETVKGRAFRFAFRATRPAPGCALRHDLLVHKEGIDDRGPASSKLVLGAGFWPPRGPWETVASAQAIPLLWGQREQDAWRESVNAQPWDLTQGSVGIRPLLKRNFKNWANGVQALKLLEAIAARKDRARFNLRSYRRYQLRPLSGSMLRRRNSDLARVYGRILQSLGLTLMQLLLGRADDELTAFAPCGDCAGTGISGDMTCPACVGIGFVVNTQTTPHTSAI